MAMQVSPSSRTSATKASSSPAEPVGRCARCIPTPRTEPSWLAYKQEEPGGTRTVRYPLTERKEGGSSLSLVARDQLRLIDDVSLRPSRHVGFRLRSGELERGVQSESVNR